MGAHRRLLLLLTDRRLAGHHENRHPCCINGPYVLGQIAFRALGQFEGHAAALFERAKPVHLNRTEMGKHVAAAALGLNESESLRIIEPLHRPEKLHLYPPDARLWGLWPYSGFWTLRLSNENKSFVVHSTATGTNTRAVLASSAHRLSVPEATIPDACAAKPNWLY